MAAALAADAPGVQRDPGTVHVGAFDLPVSKLLSPRAQRILRLPPGKDPAPCPSLADPAGMTVERVRVARACLAARNEPLIERMKVLFAVESRRASIANVPVEIFLPRNGVSSRNRHRLLINLHGGGFVAGDPSLESIPVAGLGKFEVIGVDYRMAPEYRFPAASQDVATVYRALLQHHSPRNIGIYGCSAGGRLTAQSMAWFQKTGLPNPGAIGMFSAAAAGGVYGDSAQIGSAILGTELVGDTPWRQAYFGRHPDLDNPLIAPLSSVRVMAHFPPALLISATRDFGLSNVVATHAELVDLGVPAELHVWEGLGHCFFYDPRLPESREAYAVIVRFFQSHLGAGVSRHGDR